MALGKSLLRDLVNSTIGFEGLAQEMNKSIKSLHRMLAPTGNPSVENLFQVIRIIQQNEEVKSQGNTLAKKKASVSKKEDKSWPKGTCQITSTSTSTSIIITTPP